jgi:Ni,Fe-hydrogenase III large subunit
MAFQNYTLHSKTGLSLQVSRKENYNKEAHELVPICNIVRKDGDVVRQWKLPQNEVFGALWLVSNAISSSNHQSDLAVSRQNTAS